MALLFTISFLIEGYTIKVLTEIEAELIVRKVESVQNMVSLILSQSTAIIFDKVMLASGISTSYLSSVSKETIRSCSAIENRRNRFDSVERDNHVITY